MSVSAGRSRYLSCVSDARALRPCAVTGSQPSQIAEDEDQDDPETNSGIAASESPAMVIALSVGRP